MRKTFVVLASLLFAGAASAERSATPFALPGGNIRVAFSPDGKRAIWGAALNNGWDIVESVKTSGGWSAPKPVPFNSPQSDNDPYFSGDGKTVLFISDREGGFGKSDIYSVSFDPATGVWGAAVNLGPKVNTRGDEWAPSLTASGALLFSSDGRGGYGRHDVFQVKRDAAGWGAAVNLGPGINTDADNFDAAVVPGGRYLIYSQGIVGKTDLRLNYAEMIGGSWQARGELPAGINCGKSNFAPSFAPGEPDVLYWSGNCTPGGKLGIWRGKLELPVGNR